MPALTHGRVRNGYNMASRTNNSKGTTSRHRRVASGNSNRRYATNVVVGRSAAAKRAIARRVRMQTAQTTQSNNNINGVWISNSPVTLPLVFTLPITVTWEEGSIITYQPGDDVTYNYATSGDKSIIIAPTTGDEISFNYGDDSLVSSNLYAGVNLGGAASAQTYVRNQLKQLTSYGSQLKMVSGGFKGCERLENLPASESPKLDSDISSLFEGCLQLNVSLNSWNTSGVTNMRGAFKGATSFNGDISNWDTSNVSDMESMFEGCSNLNRNFNGWNTSGVTNMQGMFKNASSFNGDISNWDTSSVTNMASAFQGASAFNADITDWDFSNVSQIGDMFSGASNFAHDLRSHADFQRIFAANDDLNSNDFFSGTNIPPPPSGGNEQVRAGSNDAGVPPGGNEPPSGGNEPPSGGNEPPSVPI